MPMSLLVTLILVLVTLTAFIVLLLIQLTRTARASERFFDSARADVNKTSEEVQVTLRGLTDLMASAQKSTDSIGKLTSSLADLTDFLGVLGSIKKGIGDFSRRHAGSWITRFTRRFSAKPPAA